MGKKLYVGNLPYSVNQQTLQDTFSKCGTVDSINVITDRDTGQSKGFAFVEMSSSSEAQKAIQEINGSTTAKSKSMKPNPNRRGPAVVGNAAGKLFPQSQRSTTDIMHNPASSWRA